MNDRNSQIGQTPCGNIFMSAVYNGNLSDYNNKTGHWDYTSHRARIPGIYSYYIDYTQYETTNWLGANINIQSGTVNNRSYIYDSLICAKGAEIEITHYMHRYFKSLMILNISLINGTDECLIKLNNCNLNDTEDFNWKQ